MGRRAGATFDAWQPTGGGVATDPQVASAGNNVYAAALTSNGGVWYNTFIQGTGNNWVGWTEAGGVLSTLTAAASTGPQLFLTGQDRNTQFGQSCPAGCVVWWYEAPGAGWKFVGYPGAGAGPVPAAPR